MSSLPPYNITFTPSSGTSLTTSDVSNALQNYSDFAEAMYVFIQLETTPAHLTYEEIEIYDPSGTNIALTGTAVQSSIHNSNAASKAIDGDITNSYAQTGDTTGVNQWWGVDLGSDKKIAGIRIYGYNDSSYIPGGSNYSRTAPFRIFLYKSADYTGTGTFADGTATPAGTGPLYYDNYQLHSSDATKASIINGNQQVFYYGINAQIGSDISNIMYTYIVDNLYSNNSIVTINKSDYYVPNLPPYNITFTPSSDTGLTTSDLSNALQNYSDFAEARYVFIQLETENNVMEYNEIEIYDPSGTNIARDSVASYKVSSQHTNSNLQVAYAFDGDYGSTNYFHTFNASGRREWVGIDLTGTNSNKKIAGIRIYGHDNVGFIPGGSYYNRHAPFRIFLYKSADYTGTFQDGGTGPLNYDNYQLHSSDATKAPVINGNQQVFYYGINAQIGSDISNVTSVADDFYSNNSIANINKSDYYVPNLPPYNITFTPSSGTTLTTSDVSNALQNYSDFAEAMYVFIQLETISQHLTYEEIEIYDPSGTNIALTGSAVQSSIHDGNAASNAIDGNITNSYAQTGDSAINQWWGVNLGSDQKIAGIRIYGYNHPAYNPGGSDYSRTAPFRIFLYKSADYTGTFADGTATPAGTGPLNYDNYQLHSSDATKAPVINGNQQVFYYGINAQIGSDISNVTNISDSIYNNTNNSILDINYDYYSGFGNYYHMDVSMHYSDLSYGVYLPTVTFTNTNNDNIFTSQMRTAQLSSQGITGFYEADLSGDITVIASGAFEGDDKVCVATINQVTDICGNAFKDCINLRAVTLDTAVDASYNYLIKNIHSGVFEGCSALKQLYIPDTVRTIDASLCAGCTNLEVAVMGYGIPRPDTVGGNDVSGTIGANAFDGCSKLQYFIVPDTVSHVYDYAFNGCSSLEHVYIGETIQSIATNAFTDICSNCIVTLPDDTPNIPNSLFNNNTFRRYTVYTIGTTGTISSGNVTNVVGYWKAKINNGVTTVSTNTFRGNYIGSTKYTNLVAISIPSSVTSWGHAVIYSDGKQSNLLSLYIPRETQINDNYPFGFDHNDVTIMVQVVCESGGGTKESGWNNETEQFYGNRSKAIILHPSVTTLRPNHFVYSFDLQLVNIFQKNAASALTGFITNNAGEAIMRGCKLEDVHIPKTVTIINGRTFTGMPNLHRIYQYTTASNQLSIGGNSDPIQEDIPQPQFVVFRYITESSVTSSGTIRPHSDPQTHVIFSNTVTSIGSSTLHEYTYLKSLTFEHGGTTPLDIQIQAFRNCQGITDGANHIKWNDREFTFSSSLSDANGGDQGIFEDCTNLTSFFIPKTFPCIPPRFLCQCTILENVYWEKDSSVTTIYTLAIYKTKITHLHIPASVASITGDHTFGLNDSLTKITFGAGSRLKHIDGFGYTSNNGTNGIIYLSNIVLPNSIKSAQDYTFHNTFKYGTLDTMVIPSSLEYIPEKFINVYGGKSRINTIYIPNSITNVAGPRRHQGYQMQGYNTSNSINPINTTKYYAPSHLNPLNTTSFTNAQDITYYDFINFPGTNGIATTLYYNGYYHAEIVEGVTTIGDTTNSQKTWIPSGLSISNEFNTTMISINVPRSVITIASNAFKNCAGLTYVTFHEDAQLTNIQSGAFQQCRNIYDISLPESLTTIGENAFRGCTKLATIKIPYNVTTFGTGSFLGCNKLEYVSLSDTLYNDISNNMGGYFSSNQNITYRVIPTIEFTADTGSELTTTGVSNQLNSNGLYKGSIYQPTFASSVSKINPQVYADFPEFTLYSNRFIEKFKTNGPYATIRNKTITPLIVGSWFKNGSTTSSGDFPLFKSIPDLNLYNVNITNQDIDNKDNYYLVMPGFTVIIFNNLYDEVNGSTGTQAGTATGAEAGTTEIFDNLTGTLPKYFQTSTADETSSILLFYLAKLIHYKIYT